MPRLSAIRLAKVGFAVAILVLVLYHAFNYEDPGMLFCKREGQRGGQSLGRVKREGPGRVVMDDHNPAVILQGYDSMCTMKTVFYHSLHECT